MQKYEVSGEAMTHKDTSVKGTLKTTKLEYDYTISLSQSSVTLSRYANQTLEYHFRQTQSRLILFPSPLAFFLVFLRQKEEIVYSFQNGIIEYKLANPVYDDQDH